MARGDGPWNIARVKAQSAFHITGVRGFTTSKLKRRLIAGTLDLNAMWCVGRLIALKGCEAPAPNTACVQGPYVISGDCAQC